MRHQDIRQNKMFRTNQVYIKVFLLYSFLTESKKKVEKYMYFCSAHIHNNVFYVLCLPPHIKPKEIKKVQGCHQDTLSFKRPLPQILLSAQSG